MEQVECEAEPNQLEQEETDREADQAERENNF
jgi:hypothetical protein